MNELKTVDDIPEDLRWLAENVHEWREGSIGVCTISREIGAGVAWQDAMHPRAYTRPQWQRARDLISGKPSWEDVLCRWGWAEYIAQSKEGHWECYEEKPTPKDIWIYESERGSCVCRSKFTGKVLGDWRKTLERRPDHLREAVETKADGYLADHINALSKALPDGVSVTVGINPGIVNLHDGVTDYQAPVDQAGDMVETWLKLSKWEVKSDV